MLRWQQFCFRSSSMQHFRHFLLAAVMALSCSALAFAAQSPDEALIPCSAHHVVTASHAPLQAPGRAPQASVKIGVAGTLQADKASYGASDKINFTFTDGGHICNYGSSDCKVILGVRLTNKTTGQQHFVPCQNTTLAAGFSINSFTALAKDVVGTGKFTAEVAYYDQSASQAVVADALDGATNSVDIEITSNANTLFITAPMHVTTSAADQMLIVRVKVHATAACTDKKMTATIAGNGLYTTLPVTITLSAGEEKTFTFVQSDVAIKAGNSYSIMFTNMPQTMFNSVSFVAKDSFGDVNADGKVDEADMSSLREYILNPATPLPDMIEADLTRDSQVNVGDVVKLAPVVR